VLRAAVEKCILKWQFCDHIVACVAFLAVLVWQRTYAACWHRHTPLSAPWLYALYGDVEVEAEAEKMADGLAHPGMQVCMDE
jgi:hypothetical protein